MHKDELLDLHEQMVLIMNHFREREDLDSSLFDAYDELEVRPSDVHKSKSEHKHAVFVLGNSLADALSDDEFSNAGRIGKRMQELADDAEQKI